MRIVSSLIMFWIICFSVLFDIPLGHVDDLLERLLIILVTSDFVISTNSNFSVCLIQTFLFVSLDKCFCNPLLPSQIINQSEQTFVFWNFLLCFDFTCIMKNYQEIIELGLV